MMLDSIPSMQPRLHEAEVISVLDRHTIHVLLDAGHSQRDVAERTGQSIHTVRRLAHEPRVSREEMRADDHAEAKRRGIGRPSLTVALEADVRCWLEQDATTPTQHLLRRAKERGYVGAKSAFYAMVAARRPKHAPPVVTFDGLPGEFSQHDFGEVDVAFADGSKKRIEFFASRLKFSRYARVSIVDDQRAETLIRCLCRDFQTFGGVPLLAVFDRPKTIVLEGRGKSREVRRFNATFAQAVLEMGVGVEMCAPRSGNQKGSVEAIVKWVKNSFFKGRVFRDEQDLVEQLEAWLHETNCERANRATNVIPETRRREELCRLRPLGVFPENLALRVPTSVGPTGHVVFEGARYVMPPETIHAPVTLFVFEDRIRIETARGGFEHRRRHKNEPIEASAEHRAARVAAVMGKRAKLYEQRQQIAELGAEALAVLTEVVHRKPSTWPGFVDRVHTLLIDHGEEVVRGALAAARSEGRFNVTAVQEHVERLLRAPQSTHSQSAAAGAHARGQLVLFARDGVRARTRGGAR